MLNRQLGLLVMAALLLSPNLVYANEIDGDSHLSVGNVQIYTNGGGTTIQTPKIQVNTPKTENRTLISRNRRRYRTPIRRTRTSPPAILHQRVSEDNHATVNTTTTYPTRSSTIRSTTIRNSSSGGDSETVSEQHQSVQCSGGGSSVSRSTSTVNGRTVTSETRGNCQ
jgi:hypothetical protein